MQLEQSFELPFPRAAVWSAFQDIPMLVTCLPGASLTSAPGARPLAFTLAVKLGPVAAKFSGEGDVTYEPDHRGLLSGSGADRATGSRVKGSAAFSLHEAGGGTRVDLAIDYTLTGTLAQFGRTGIVRELAAGITRQFAANLQARLGSDVVAASGAAPAQAAPAAPVPLDGSALLWNALWSRLKRLFGMA
ncbi:MAG: CoxG family protein [Burkholderiales bacterium]